MFYEVKNGQVYNHGEKVSDEEVETMLNNYEYEKRRYTVHMHEKVIETMAINRHLKRENRLILSKIHKLISMGPIMNEDVIDKELAAINDDWIKLVHDIQLENQTLKRKLEILKD